RSRWAEYLNGSSLIPRHLLGEVVKELGRTQPGWDGKVLVEANDLWKKAKAGAPLAPDSGSAELVSVYRKLTATSEALRTAEQIKAEADLSISKLLKLGGRQETKIAELTDEVERLQEKERTEAAHRLEQARFRLSRVKDELQLARSDRYTAEQAQAVLLREQEEALQEVKRLQQAVTGLAQTEVEVEVEPTLLPERLPEPDISDEESDRETDERLDLISTNRELRGAMLSEVLQQAHMTPETTEEGRPQTIRGTVITQHTQTPEPADRPASPTLAEPVYPLSRTTLDNPATSNDTSIPASSTRPNKRRRVLLATLLVVILGASVPLAYERMSERSVSTSTDGPSSKPSPSSTPTAKD
ncbi:hypothetical protein ACFWOJ_39815, partial [Streptomyces sp. NPDC058439]|uniref:hypothetical protein n=1 Tax=Streptomyces sp. NPDC058439 TaxID=3346500 RepID=UPI00365F4E9E